MKLTGTFIGNNTAVTEIFSRLMDQFNLMLRRRAFTHWYNGEGLDDQEFSEVSHFLGIFYNLRFLLSKFLEVSGMV